MGKRKTYEKKENFEIHVGCARGSDASVAGGLWR